MKILVLMPCDEQHVYAASKIYERLPAEVKDHTFAMPMFMQYLISTKIVGNWVFAFYDTLLSAEKLLDAAENDDFILIGNCPNYFKFDAVFNFQDIEEMLPYQDAFIEKIKTLVAEDAGLSTMIATLHEAKESQLALINCQATADFLAAYLKTDPHLEEIKKQFKNLNFKEIEDERITTSPDGGHQA